MKILAHIFVCSELSSVLRSNIAACSWAGLLRSFKRSFGRMLITSRLIHTCSKMTHFPLPNSLLQGCPLSHRLYCVWTFSVQVKAKPDGWRFQLKQIWRQLFRDWDRQCHDKLCYQGNLEVLTPIRKTPNEQHNTNTVKLTFLIFFKTRKHTSLIQLPQLKLTIYQDVNKCN